ncbi:DUF302 domain-containing protein (plasmid) [Rhizobium leguminosarum]|uniref:DUF302 domain-containing protein n=2 Tax=Rhizobium leguminosarum TaxID=384 RepID=A0A2L1CSD4_RHILV|nr:DUF302 domain-containing protein [Rhizobium leguminosarum]ASS59321.1 DUF302 domain-containing protein [Rhizobium leguminosarum bv. viciae]AVC47637.1 hypothetical protein RLV_1409 [Rhizobium leguminosarum bv. viciae]MBB4331863.1 uncharacterized protein (DUF302 family) [Rhizobium leguminosarum]MBB4345558.1 uncharacterized protein (DUF302 family) [Rhizobium leguminosarum]MBB4357488.1 uncharacterized protein (DUF302 family) [Rhizobium leguminosarum]
MTYTLDRTLWATSFDDAVGRTKSALSKHGFGVLTEIDVKATMKKKIDADIDDYLILGACNPRMAFEAMRLEPKVGAMLPCNVILRGVDGGDVMVSAIDPVASMQAIDNEVLNSLASKVRSMLAEVVAEI